MTWRGRQVNWRLALAVLFVVWVAIAPMVVYGQDPGNMTTGLVSCWDLEEFSGPREDAFGSNDLTDNNTVGNAAGVVNNAASFIASNLESLSVTSNSGLQAGDIDFTLSGWIYLGDKSADRPLINKWLLGGGDREYRLGYLQSSDRFVFAVRNTGNTANGSVEATALGSPSINTWYLVTGWHNATNDTINIQVNDGTVSSLSWSSGIRVSGSTLLLGRLIDGNNFYHDGRMDTTILAKTVWSSDQRTWLYNGGAGRSCQDLITTSYTPTPSNTPTATSTATPTLTPTPSNTPTATPTPTPSPGPKVYPVDLPEGGRAYVVFNLTVGEVMITVGLLAVVALLAFRQLVDLSWLNAKR